MTETNDWCRLAGLNRPVLADIKPSARNNVYVRLIATLLERGEPMTLAQVAERFEQVGWAPKDTALRSLQRCKPARAPVHRDGDLYALNPHDSDLSLHGFMLGLRPPRVIRPPRVTPEPEPLPDDSVPLTSEELDEAWKDRSLYSVSNRRTAMAILEADGHPQAPGAVVAALNRRTTWHKLTADQPQFCRRNSPIMVLPDGRWTLRPTAEPDRRKVRALVRKLLATRRRDPRPTEEEREAARRRYAQERWVSARRLSRLHRVVLRALPVDQPLGVAIKDLRSGAVETFWPADYPALIKRLNDFDLIAGEQIYATLRALNMTPGERRLIDLAPPQKQMRVGQRVLKITTPKLIFGSCGIVRPFGDEKATLRRLAAGQRSGLTRLAKDVEHLALYEEYSRLQRTVSLQQGQWKYPLLAKWVHADERGLLTLMKTALEADGLLEIVRVSAVQLGETWERAELVHVLQVDQFKRVLIDESRREVHRLLVQRARLGPTIS